MLTCENTDNLFCLNVTILQDYYMCANYSASQCNEIILLQFVHAVLLLIIVAEHGNM